MFTREREWENYRWRSGEQTSEGNSAQRRWHMKMAFPCINIRTLLCTQSTIRVSITSNDPCRMEPWKHTNYPPPSPTPASVPIPDSPGMIRQRVWIGGFLLGGFWKFGILEFFLQSSDPFSFLYFFSFLKKNWFRTIVGSRWIKTSRCGWSYTTTVGEAYLYGRITCYSAVVNTRY